MVVSVIILLVCINCHRTNIYLFTINGHSINYSGHGMIEKYVV